MGAETSKINKIDNNQLGIPDWVLARILNEVNTFKGCVNPFVTGQNDRLMNLTSQANGGKPYYLSLVCSYWHRKIINQSITTIHHGVPCSTIHNYVYKKVTHHPNLPFALFNHNQSNNEQTTKINTLKLIYNTNDMQQLNEQFITHTPLIARYCPHLTHLTLYKVPITVALFNLSNCKSLSSFTIYPSRDHINHFSILAEFLSKTPSITTLSIKCNSTEVLLEPMNGLVFNDAFNNIQSFTLINYFGSNGFVRGTSIALNFMPSLRHLHLRHNSIANNNLGGVTGLSRIVEEFIKELPNPHLLESLRLDNIYYPTNLDPLTDSIGLVPNLRYLCIDGLTATSFQEESQDAIDGLILSISKLAKLDRLTLKSIDLTQLQTETLMDKLKQLKRLKIIIPKKRNGSKSENDHLLQYLCHSAERPLSRLSINSFNIPLLYELITSPESSIRIISVYNLSINQLSTLSNLLSQSKVPLKHTVLIKHDRCLEGVTGFNGDNGVELIEKKSVHRESFHRSHGNMTTFKERTYAIQQRHFHLQDITLVAARTFSKAA